MFHYDSALKILINAQLTQLFATVKGEQFPPLSDNLTARVCLDALVSTYATYAALCGMSPEAAAAALRAVASEIESGRARATGQALMGPRTGVLS